MSFPPFVYYGTDEFSVKILRGLLAVNTKPELIVTTVPQPSGRGLKIEPTAIAKLAQAQNLPYLEVGSLKKLEVERQIKDNKTAFAILAAFGRIIPPTILDLYPRGIINVHPSLLSLYRGPSPMQYAIKDRQKETGVSLILLDEAVDHGPILAQVKYQISEQETAVTLADNLAPLAVKLLFESIPPYLDNLLKAKDQDHTKATFTAMIKRIDGQADFSKSASELDAKRRAFTPWPSLWTTWQGQRLKLINTAVWPDYQGVVGGILLVDGQVIIGTAQGGLLVKTLQLEGGKPLVASDFIRGHKDFINSSLL